MYKELGYTQSSFANACGISNQTLRWCLSVVDDCKLSKLQTMLTAIGLNIRPSLSALPTSPFSRTYEIAGTKCRIIGNLDGVKKKSLLPDYINSINPENRLYFLRDFLENCRMPIGTFCEKSELDISTIRECFLRDDIKISALYKAAEKLNAELTWSITPIKEQNGMVQA